MLTSDLGIRVPELKITSEQLDEFALEPPRLILSKEDVAEAVGSEGPLESVGVKHDLQTARQLPRLNRIVALKDLGFSLKEIRGFLEQDVLLEDLRKMLEHKQAELTEQLQTESARLARLQVRLKHIELEDIPLGFDITVKVPAMTIFSKRYAVPDLAEMDKYCTLFYSELYAVLNAQVLVPIAPEFTLFHTREYVAKNVDIEVAVVLSSDDLARLEAVSWLYDAERRG